MRSLTATMCLCVSQAAMAAPASPLIVKAAPAPVIGAGIPVALAVGAVLLGATLVTRWRRH